MLAKAKRPRLSFALLVPVAFAPDWIELVLHVGGINDHVYSHSIVSVGIGATLVALATWAITRGGADALVVWLTYLSHWPADFITGIKPTWPGGPMVGLMLYNRPRWDVVIESALVVVCSLVYLRSLPRESRTRLVALLVPLGLVAMEIAVAVAQTPRLL